MNLLNPTPKVYYSTRTGCPSCKRYVYRYSGPYCCHCGRRDGYTLFDGIEIRTIVTRYPWWCFWKKNTIIDAE